jgi:hypothetical protein
VSNSRRGLLAAGLVTAVVGSMGVVWTLNANAGETPPAEAPAAAPAPVVADAAEEPLFVPPKLLPWGAKPKKIKLAKAGAKGKAIAAAGAGAAPPADPSGSPDPEAEFAPKGRTLPDDRSESTRDRVAPPAPPGVRQAKADVSEGEFDYHYAVGAQEGQTDGTWSTLTINKPVQAKNDYHTLAEITVQSADRKHAVEVGWTVDRALNPDDATDAEPHLFIFSWEDDEPRCYVQFTEEEKKKKVPKCGFTLHSGTIAPGFTLPVPVKEDEEVQKRFGIRHSDGAWWIAYDSEWIGYFPDSEWEGRFTKGGRSQWFGEVASPKGVLPCSTMGNGLLGYKGKAARLGSITLTGGPEVKPEIWATNSAYYSVGWSLPDTYHTFRYGGPGAVTGC